MYALR
jgi:hypothetical protein